MNKNKMRYIKNKNQGVLALIKKDGKYEYNAIDSPYCVIQDYIDEIENGEYFNWISESKLNYDLMVQDFSEVRKSNNKTLLDDYLLWEKPNIFIDFDSKTLVNYYPDRTFEDTVPKPWEAKFVREIEQFIKYIPINLRYWVDKE